MPLPYADAPGATSCAACATRSVRSAATPCGACSVVTVAALLSLGIWLLVLASAQASAVCEVPLAAFARVDGACYLVAGLLGGVAAAAFVLWAPPLEGAGGGGVPRAALAGGLVSVCALAALALGWLGVKLWGTVLLFGNDLWTRQMLQGAAALPAPCDPALYSPLAIFMIIAWTLPAGLLGLAALAALAFALAEAYAAATGAGARKRRDEDAAAEAERNPWLAEFEGMRATNPWERDVAHALDDDASSGGGAPGLDGLPPLKNTRI